MNSRPRMARCRCEVQAFDRRPMAEIRKRRPPKKLVRELGRAAAEVAADQVLVHRFQVAWGEDRSAQDQLAKTGGQSFYALFDAVGKSLPVRGPAAFEIRRHVRVGPERVLAGRCS